MAEYRAKGLFEAMQGSKIPPQRPAAPVVVKSPPPAGAPSGPRVADIFGDTGGRVARVATGRRVLIAVVVIVVAVGLIWGVKALVNWQAGRAAEREMPIVVAAAGQPAEERAAEQPIPGVPAVPAAPVEPAPPADSQHGGLLPQTGDMPAIGNSTVGTFRIQIFSAPSRNHDEMEKERRKLASAGVETTVEQRGTWHYVFTASTFATIDGEATAESLKKIRGLGYASAYATRKQTGNR
jgi:hypothetical protein